jgi:glycosyltransferase involved in cell wall biosynthesis
VTDLPLKDGSSRDVILVSTADWDHPFWTNKQHVAVALASLGHRVLYVESVGLRPPRLEAQDLRRIWRRLRRGLRPPRRVAPRLWVWSPLLLPAPRSPFQRGFNRCVFATLLALWRRTLHLRADLLWTYNPLIGQLLPLQPSGFRQLAYHCVDDLAAQPCMPAALIAHEEERLCRACDQVFVTSPALLKSRGCWNPHTRYDPNVADVVHFAQARDGNLPVASDLQALPPGPRLGFVGAVSGYKLDLGLLARLAHHRSDCQLVLIGRVGEGDPETDLAELMGLRNVHLLGPRPYGQLPSYLRGFDLALLPCPMNAYTRSMFPMKFFEYLAAGLPVVATDLPALAEYGSLARLCANPSSFLAAVDASLTHPQAPDAARSIPLENLPEWCSYGGRTQLMLAELNRRLIPTTGA